MVENNCSECNACVQICKHQAIELKVNEEGFSYPCINIEKCIHCNLCIEVCPMQNGDKVKLSNLKVLAVQIKNNKTLQKSSSGGVFSVSYTHLRAHEPYRRQRQMCIRDSL